MFIAVTVVAVLMWAVASLMDLGAEFGFAALAGLAVSANSGFFLGLAFFSLLFVALFVVMGSVAGRWSLVADGAASAVVAWIAGVSFGTLFGLAGFVVTFLVLGGLISRMETAGLEARSTAPPA